jgi:hypothetical protein
MSRCCARRSKNAAIDDKLCSLDVSCLIRREKEDGAGYIFGPADAISGYRSRSPGVIDCFVRLIDQPISARTPSMAVAVAAG